MGFLKSLSKMDQRFSWSFLGFLLALIFGGITIYISFIEDKNPEIVFEVTGNTSVVDLHEDVTRLEVLFNGSDIKKLKQALRVLTIKIRNVGKADVLKNFYDDKDPSGFLVQGASTLTAELIDASNTYLSQSISLKIDSTGRITYYPIILESNESFTVKVMVLHKEDVIPSVVPLGKIAGVKEIKVLETYKELAQKSDLEVAFEGGVLVQLIRLVSYSTVVVLLVVMTIASFVFLENVFGSLVRSSHINQYKKSTNRSFIQNDELIFSIYKEDESYKFFLLAVCGLLNDKKLIELISLRAKGKGFIDKGVDVFVNVSGARESLSAQDVLRLSQLLFGEGFGEDKKMQETLIDFIKFLKNKRAIGEGVKASISYLGPEFKFSDLRIS